MFRTLFYTVSVCPKCLKLIPAEIVGDENEVSMRKSCGEHGAFDTVIWEDSADSFLKWLENGALNPDEYPKTLSAAKEMIRNSSFSENAKRLPGSAALMTTDLCNVNCPVCFTRTEECNSGEMSLTEIEILLRNYYDESGNDSLLELCGGEPTTRADLPEIANIARSIGFDYIQLNSNGIKLAESVDYCRELKENGVTTVYLGFEGMTEAAYLTKYGREMLEIKKAAVSNCGKAGLAVVLVCCVIPGASSMELGDIISYAKDNIPTVKGVYLQPISYFGTYSEEEQNRITIPEVLRKLEAQTNGEIKQCDFNPANYEHPQCSFNANYIMGNDGKLFALSQRKKRTEGELSVHAIRRAVRMTWLPSDNPTLTIGGMAFQDAMNIDIVRVKKCSVQILGKDGRMVSLCSKYLTDSEHRKLNPGIN